MSIDDIDVFWVLLCACLVWIMQGGFLCLETGLTRSKNNINVAMKNICDNATSIFLFWLIGFSIAFGAPFSAPFNLDSNYYFFESNDNRLNAFFVFQAVFCSTCCTIVSGAAAERLRFIMYPVLVAIIAALIYPVVVNAVWRGTLVGDALGPLSSLGFYDFAGSTVVHSTGGWVALALVLILGPRLGRFDKQGRPQTIQGSNLTLSSLGVLVLWFGWLGFNGGSAYNFESDIGIILSNTLISGSSSLVITLLMISRKGRLPAAEDLINGALGGLVGITAAANCVSSISAFLIGAGSAVSVLAVSRLLLRFRQDDVVGAIPVHLGAGIWGTLAVGLLGDLEAIGSGLTRMEQIGAQCIGIVAVGVWAFVTALLIMKLVNHFFPFRVSVNDETIGLNISEHGATTELYELIAFMKRQSETGCMASKAPTDLFTESGVIGMAYNHVMDTLRHNQEKLKQVNLELERANENLRSYDHIVAHDLKNPIAIIRSYASLIEDSAEQGTLRTYIERIRRSSEDALAIIKELLDFSKSGGSQDAFEVIDLETLVDKVSQHLQHEIEQHRARIELQTDIQHIWFNPIAMQQALVNIISNAIKYADAERTPLILIRARHEGSQDVIEVQDNGMGMNDAQLERVFDLRSRLHTDIKKVSGHGVGMYNVKRMIETGGGELLAESIPDAGSRFIIRIQPRPAEQSESVTPESDLPLDEGNLLPGVPRG